MHAFEVDPFSDFVVFGNGTGNEFDHERRIVLFLDRRISRLRRTVMKDPL